MATDASTAPDASAEPPARRTRRALRAWRVDLTVLGVAALVLRLPAYLADRHLTFDDGVFGASAVAMRAGGRPFADVFSSQGPLFLPLVWVGDVVGLRTSVAPRTLAVAAGVALALLAYVAGREVTDRRGALLAGGLTATTASVLWVTGPLAADGPALALGTAAVALALRWRRDPSGWRAVALGVAVGATLAVKSLLAPVVVPVAIVLVASGRWRPILVGAGTAIALHLVVALPWGLGDVWDQSYAYHLEVAGERTPGANLRKVASTLGDRDLPVLVAAGLAAGWAASRRWRPSERSVAAPRDRGATAATPGDAGGGTAGGPAGGRAGSTTGGNASPGWLRRWGPRLPATPDVLVWSWLVATLVVLSLEHPMWRPHVAHLVPALALLAARHRPPVMVMAAAAMVVVPYHVVHSWDVLAPDPYRGAAADAVELLGDLPDDALAISDDPGVVWRAGRRTTHDLVDTSILRIEAERITEASLVAEAARDDVCAVAIWSRQRWGSFAGLPGALDELGFELRLDAGPGRQVYVDPACAP